MPETPISASLMQQFTILSVPQNRSSYLCFEKFFLYGKWIYLDDITIYNLVVYMLRRGDRRTSRNAYRRNHQKFVSISLATRSLSSGSSG